ncbi:MAG TPA: hypothetical protein VFQ45_13765 [Longimicrobium sp.]|nr:hypothetical protein [Longimicrobium sp.]
MRLLTPFAVLGLAAALAACSDLAPAPTAPEATAAASLLPLGSGDTKLKKPKINVTKWLNKTIRKEPHLLLPAGAEGIGPGSPILITIPNDGTYGCSANFVWREGNKLYLGAAGHCFVSATAKSTHGEGADFDASGVTVDVCVTGCEGNFDAMQLVGTVVRLGKVAYARQTDPTATEDVGNDFGVVEIPAEAAHLVRAALPVWGGFEGVETMEFGQYACHFGNGTVTGELFVTKARVGVGGGSDAASWYGDFVAAPGDSGSGIIACEPDGLSFSGTRAIGVLTHLGVATGEVAYNGIETKVEHGFVLGTTIARAIEMAHEAGLNLTLVEP